MKKSILLMLGFSVLTLGQSIVIRSANANDTGGTDSLSINSVNTTSTGGNLTGDLADNTEAFSFIDLQGEFGISQEVFDLIPNISLNEALGTDGTGDSISNTILGTTDNSSQEGGDSQKITICLSNPCLPEEDGGKAITLNDLAKLIEDDLNESLTDLIAAEALEKEVASKPRVFARRRSSSTCVSPVGEARREVTTKLQQSREFVETMEQLKPENSPW